MKTLRGARAMVFFGISSLSTPGRLGKEEQIQPSAAEGRGGGQSGGGISKDEVSQERMAKKSLPVVRKSHK